MGSSEDKFPDAHNFLISDIGVLAKSPFGQSHDGQKIVRLLRELNANGKITFEKMEDRGNEDGKSIQVNADFYGRWCRTVPILAHEGAHVVWRKQKDDVVLDELRSELIELEVYAWLNSTQGCKAIPDPELESRMSFLGKPPKGPYPIPGIGGDKRYLGLKTRIEDVRRSKQERLNREANLPAPDADL